MRIAAPTLMGALAALTCWACGEQPSTVWHDEGGFRWRELDFTKENRDGFTQLDPSRTGIDFVNPSGEARPLWTSHMGHGSGVALGDVDGDGLEDIYLTSIELDNVLYRNLGDWRFEDVTSHSGVAAPDRPSTGAAMADVDGDGDLDLLVTALGGPNSLFVNDGRGNFTEFTEEAGLASNRASGTMTLADVDGDGDLDLYIANYKIGTAEELFSPEELAFEQIVRKVGDEYQITPKFKPHYRVRAIPELGLVAHIQRAEPDWFYLNDGTGKFTAVSFTSDRFVDENGNRYEEEPDYFGLAARFYDVDGDNDPDLYVCNDFDDPDLFWLNEGDGRFRAVPAVALRATSSATMAIDFADIDRDGDVDFFTTDMLPAGSRRRKAQQPSYTPLPKLVGQIDYRPQTQRNALFVNRGDTTFVQIAEYAGVEASDWTWATLFLDVDLDGYEDILVTTGHLWDQFDQDNIDRMRRMPEDVDWSEKRRIFSRFETPNVAFHNRGDSTFAPMGREWGFSNEPDVSHGPATGDLDSDGDLDVVINRLGKVPAVLRNESGRSRVAVRLAGLARNTQGVGAKIRLLGGAVPVQEREVTLGGMYLSSSTAELVFATGEATEMSIEVVWRNGSRTVLSGVRPNRLYEIREPSATAEPPVAGPAAPAPMFSDRSDDLRHSHTDALYDDFARQPLLPNKLSQLGPGVTWHDMDSDGDEDLIVTAGRGGSLARFRNDAGRLARVVPDPPLSSYDQTTALGLAEASTARLLVAQALYEAADLQQALSQPAVFSLGPGSARVRPEVSGDNNSVGPLALADIDGDGDLDLFVGGRVIPAAYPLPPSSRILRNTGGTFIIDEQNSAVLTSAGMVSAAVFSDIDGDGDPDLVLALEWGPIKLFLNDGGTLTDGTAAWGLADQASRWNGITTGDLNNDGRPDLIATSWGLNTKHRASASRPLLLYYSDFDRNGSFDVLLAQYDDEIDGIAPLADGRADLVAAMSFVGRRVTTATEYSNATVEDVIGPVLEEAGRLAISDQRHKLFLNLGGSFSAAALPAEAQLAPAFYAGAADFDGDGNEDVILAQNFYPTALKTPRYDAGRGLLLLGDGRGGLHPVPGQVSGLKVYGDSRGAAFADYDADGRTDIAISQNGAATKLYRNDGAAVGLRVRLIGPPANRDAIGAAMRLVYERGRGPLREVHAGSGYWSQDGAVQVLGNHTAARAVWVRWPDGREVDTPLPPGSTELTIRYDR